MLLNSWNILRSPQSIPTTFIRTVSKLSVKSLSVNFSIKVLLLFSGSLFLTIQYRLFLLILIKNIGIRCISVGFQVIFTIRLDNCAVDCILAFVYKCCTSLISLLLVLFFTLLSTLASGLLPGNVLLLLQFWNLGLLMILQTTDLSVSYTLLGLSFDEVLFNHIYPRFEDICQILSLVSEKNYQL